MTPVGHPIVKKVKNSYNRKKAVKSRPHIAAYHCSPNVLGNLIGRTINEVSSRQAKQGKNLGAAMQNTIYGRPIFQVRCDPTVLSH